MSMQDELIQRLREANPVPPGSTRGAGLEPRAQRVFEAIVEREFTPPPARRRFPVAAGLAAALAVILVAVLVVSDRDITRRQPEGVLAAAARVAEGNDSLVPGPGEYVYVRTEVITSATIVGEEAFTVLLPKIREVWAAADGSGRIREVPEDLIFPGPRDERRWREFGAPTFEDDVTDREVGPGRLLPPEVANLPADPEALREFLSREPDGDLPRPAAAFDRVAELLAQPLVDGATRARLFRFLATAPDVEVLGPVTDPLGRPGTAVGLTHDEYGNLVQRILIFDPDTSAVLADEVRLLEPSEDLDAEPPFTVSSRVQLAVGVTDSIDARP